MNPEADNRPITNPSDTLNPDTYKRFFFLSALEGIAVLILLFLTPSEANRSVFLRFSASRLLLVTITIALTILFVSLFLQSHTNKDRLLKYGQGIHNVLIDNSHLSRVFIILLILTIGLLIFILCFAPPVTEHINNLPYTLPDYSVAEDVQNNILTPFAGRFLAYWTWLHAAAARALPFLVWLVVLCIQSIGLLLHGYGKTLRQRWHVQGRDRFYRIAFLTLIVCATLFHWLTLLLRLKTFLLIRGWKWYFWQKETELNLWLFPVILAITIGITLLVLSCRRKKWLCLALAVFLGYGLQVGFGYIAGGGFESLKNEYANSVFNYYAIEATNETSLMDTLKDYESLYGPHGYLGTKPPGVHIFYVATQKIADLIHKANTAEGRFEQATTLMAYLYPLLAILVLIPLIQLGQRLITDKDNVMLPALLYITCPNVILITLFLDQALYPLLFISGLLLAYFTMQKNSLKLSLLLGIYLYTVVYFGFSLLSLIPLVLLWIVVNYFIQRQKRSFRDMVILLCGIVMGLLVSYLLFNWLLHYDFITRYQRSFEYHKEIKEFAPGLAMLGYTAVLNNAEFFSWTGFPIVLLFLSNFIRGMGAFIRRKATTLDGLLLSFSLAYAGVVVFGQTFGEVQRLYIFMVPLFALFASEEIQYRFKNKKALLITVITLQLITTLLLFIFQDYYA